MHILIVEDQALMQELMEGLIGPVLRIHTDAKISKAFNLPDALSIIAQDPPPDVCLLDLKLGSGLIRETLDCIPEMSKRTAVILVTGYPAEAIAAGVPIVSKDENMPKTLPLTLIRLLLSLPGGKWANADHGLQRMKELEEKISNGTTQ